VVYGAEDLDVINPEMASLRVPDQWIPISKRANFNDTIEICATVELANDDRAALRSLMRRSFDLRPADVPKSIEICEKHVFENSRFKETRRTWRIGLRGTKGKQRIPREYGAKTDEWQSAVAHPRGKLPRIWYFPNFLFELPERFALAAVLLDGDDEGKNRDCGTSLTSGLQWRVGVFSCLTSVVIHRPRKWSRCSTKTIGGTSSTRSSRLAKERHR
jgi:hypothetical protein